MSQTQIFKNCHTLKICTENNVSLVCFIFVLNDSFSFSFIVLMKGRAFHFTGISPQAHCVYTCVSMCKNALFLQPSRPVSSRPLSRVSTASSGPSAEVLDVLEKLGKLSESHDALTKRVEVLEVSGYTNIHGSL